MNQFSQDELLDPVLAGDQLTCGSFDTEEASCASLDGLVENSGCFRIHREINCRYMQPRYGTPDSRGRIDRLLIPSQKLIDAGWKCGPIGIECKKSGEKLGPVLAQTLDYKRGVFELPHGFLVVLDLVFIWPLSKQHGTIASLMAQQRVGSVDSCSYTPLKFFLGEIPALRLLSDWTPEVCTVACGRRVGSR